MAVLVEGDADGASALSFLKETEPVAWLAPHSDLSLRTKAASQFLFALSSSTAAASQCPIKHLLVHNFDPEQIWQQIDMQATPLLASARRILRRIERDTDSVVLIDTAKATSEIGMHEEELEIIGRERKEEGSGRSQIESVDEDEEEEEEEEDEEEEEEEEEDEESHEEEDDDESGSGGDNAVEDEFFKLKDMKKFLDEAEAVDDGPGNNEDEDEDEDEEDEEEGEYIDMDDGEELLDNNTEDELEEGLKYNAFFKDKSKVEKSDGVDETLTTHEKQVAKVRKRIEQLEKANIESDVWTMRGEVSAPKRPKNSALEVELDFEHNVRPPPVITEEVTASLEDLIRKRIAEHNFDDVQRTPSLSTSTSKEVVELDETKSKKGLAEIYEANYMQTTGLAPAPTSQADEIRKEATQLFKALCVKLDALSHFHFTPKPVIEDMTVRPDVPALAMEEIAPLLVSDAQLLAPEEVFTGEGVVKAEAELSRDERKRRRARKKEKAKSIKRRTELNKKQGPTVDKSGEVKGSSQGSKKTQRSDFVKSTKVFEQLDGTRNGKKQLVEAQDLHAPFLKL